MPSQIGIALSGIQNAQFDPDAIAFLSVTGLTDAINSYAINNLVTDMKLNGIWNKMYAVYPFAGTTSTTQKWNLKDPRDLDAAYRLSFVGGITHSINGMQPNGTNGYANTFFNPATVIGTTTSVSLGVYVNGIGSGTRAYDLGVAADANVNMLDIISQRSSGSVGLADFGTFPNGRVETGALSSGLGQTIGAIRSATDRVFFQNGVKIASSSTNLTPAYASGNIPIGAYNIIDGAFAGIAQFINNRYAFVFIGSGLTDSEILTYTSIIQRYQNAVSRSTPLVPTVQDTDAQNFLVAAGITDATQAQAIQNLVAGLKYYSLWSKMQAAYPFVGGSATTNKFNLKSPFDANTSFRLSFSGGWTHSSTGSLPNGTNGYADTFYVPATYGSQDDAHASIYLRTNTQVNGKDFGVQNTSPTRQTYIGARDTSNQQAWGLNSGSIDIGSQTDSRGLWTVTRSDASNVLGYKNSTLLNTNALPSTGRPTSTYFMAAFSNAGTAAQFTNREFAWASIGSGLSGTDITNLYTVVQAYETALSRQV